ncbi:GNAT family N-acetyltransferase [Tunturibacter psychrotolerans]|uniref:GNAT family N-acetyltransferase n=1 Tax=Tunturiibacter psychrotolerans TaxID=3069686 RepID=A0AAU7ZUE9_9BACT
MDRPALDTPRLSLRPLELTDAAQVQPLFARWEIVKQLNAKVPWPFPDDGVHTFYRDSALPAIARGQEFHWMLRRKNDPEQRVIGSITLKLNGDKNRGFWIAREWQRLGLMTEAAAEVTRFWFQDLNQPVLRVIKARDNAASRAISLRQGMRIIAETEGDYVSGRLPSEQWELTFEDWRKMQHNNQTGTKSKL